MSFGSVYGYVRLSTNEHLGMVADWLILLDYAFMPSLLTILAAISLGHLVQSVPVALVVAGFVGVSLLLNLLGIGITTRVGLVLLAIQVAVIAMFAWFVLGGVASGSFTSAWTAFGGRICHGQRCCLRCRLRPSHTWASTPSPPSTRRPVEAAGPWPGPPSSCWPSSRRCSASRFLAFTVTPSTGFAPGTGTTRAFYAAVDAVAPAWYQPLFTLTNALVAILACLVVAHASSARLVFAMARDGVLPRRFAATTAKGVPHVATLLVAAVTLVVALLFADHAEQLTSMVTFGALASYVVLHVAVMWGCLVREHSGRWVAHLVVPTAGIVSLVVVLASAQELTRWVVLGWLAAGMTFHAVRVRRRASRPSTPLPRP